MVKWMDIGERSPPLDELVFIRVKPVGGLAFEAIGEFRIGRDGRPYLLSAFQDKPVTHWGRIDSEIEVPMAGLPGWRGGQRLRNGKAGTPAPQIPGVRPEARDERGDPPGMTGSGIG